MAQGFDSLVAGAFALPGLLADRQGLKSPGMQDVDRPPHVKALPEPAGASGPRVQLEPGRLILHSERLDGIVGDRWRTWDVGQRSSVRSPEP